jgi:DNA-binding transcriptional regulator YiaG
VYTLSTIPIQNGTRSQFKFLSKNSSFTGYPAHPITVGDHIRKKRMELGLLQREDAEIIGVTESSVWNWEHGVEPEHHYNP